MPKDIRVRRFWGSSTTSSSEDGTREARGSTRAQGGGQPRRRPQSPQPAHPQAPTQTRGAPALPVESWNRRASESAASDRPRVPPGRMAGARCPRLRPRLARLRYMALSRTSVSCSGQQQCHCPRGPMVPPHPAGAPPRQPAVSRSPAPPPPSDSPPTAPGSTDLNEGEILAGGPEGRRLGGPPRGPCQALLASPGPCWAPGAVHLFCPAGFTVGLRPPRGQRVPARLRGLPSVSTGCGALLIREAPEARGCQLLRGHRLGAANGQHLLQRTPGARWR